MRFRLVREFAIGLLLAMIGCNRSKKTPIPEKEQNYELHHVSLGDPNNPSNQDQHRGNSNNQLSGIPHFIVIPDSQDELDTKLQKKLTNPHPSLSKPNIGAGLALNSNEGPYRVCGCSISDGRVDTTSVLPLDHGQKFIKYGINCENGEIVIGKENHPIERNFIVMHILRDLGATISPKVIGVSDPEVIPKGTVPSWKGITMTDYASCFESELMYLIMESAGLSIRKYYHLMHGVSTKEAFDIGLSVMRLLQQIHERGLVHGDIHWENVVLKNVTAAVSSTGELALIDWDRAHFPSNDKLLPQTQLSRSPREYWSPREMDDPTSRETFGDDVFRAYEMIRVMLIGEDFYSEIPIVNPTEFKKIKERPFLESGHRSAQKLLDELHEIVLNGMKKESDPSELYKIEYIMERLRDCLIEDPLCVRVVTWSPASGNSQNVGPDRQSIPKSKELMNRIHP